MVSSSAVYSVIAVDHYGLADRNGVGVYISDFTSVVNGMLIPYNSESAINAHSGIYLVVDVVIVGVVIPAAAHTAAVDVLQEACGVSAGTSGNSDIAVNITNAEVTKIVDYVAGIGVVIGAAVAVGVLTVCAADINSHAVFTVLYLGIEYVRILIRMSCVNVGSEVREVDYLILVNAKGVGRVGHTVAALNCDIAIFCTYKSALGAGVGPYAVTNVQLVTVAGSATLAHTIDTDANA